ncbi:hypothetical protein MNBD_ALPHA02-1689 [hydrothermal vent metagenome]|uniref:Periplasmic heavy metal sensor n=1 Tax=hydrothermal vent metagenome TaxID=652676 RepID=A0A3B0RIW2_9ZZZZ
MAEKSKKANWVNVVLFFSLALNFFVVGYLVSDTRMFRNLHDRKIFHKRPDVRIVDFFPRSEKKKFRKFMRQQHEKLMPVQRDLSKSQREIFKAISKREVDEAELRQAFEKYQVSNDRLQNTINEMVIEMVMDMDYDTRRKIIMRGEKAHERWKMMRERWQKNKK